MSNEEKKNKNILNDDASQLHSTAEEKKDQPIGEESDGVGNKEGDEATDEMNDEMNDALPERSRGDNDDDLIDGIEAHTGYKIPGQTDNPTRYNLSGMYRHWFLDYASYVILERAVPNIYDGLKPVQRRILHSMKRLDDGRYNKVANIVGHTMQFHPHGDASIGDALVQLGQKDLLIDCQGNWGNIYTGDGAAAPRYIEARLSKFALDTVFNPKTTEWKLSYDGRNKEPITLPIKFPLLLAQGVEGIAVGLNSKILPHNFNELIDACIAYLKGEEFELFPDFQTGGMIDVSRYSDGERGGSVKVRAKISKLDNRTLAITELPFGVTTSKLIDSIIRESEKGKIKIRKVDDNTSAEVEVLVHLQSGASSDKAIDALYAFTDCEISISPNCCVIHDNKPHFLTVSDALRTSCEHTKDLLQLELEIEKGELQEQLFFTSLEKIFIENRIYKDKEFEESTSQNEVIKHIDKRLDPFKKDLIREVKREDILKLLEIRMMRITRFDSDKADKILINLKKKIKEINYQLKNLVEYTIFWYEELKAKYGKDYPRQTEIRSFETIVAAKVVAANEKLYVNHKEGFIGTDLKKDEFVCNCSHLDDVIVFFRDGTYKVVRVADKLFVGKNILYLNVFRRNDSRTVYNLVYRHGRTGPYYIKRFAVEGVTRDREYDLTQGKAGSRVMYFTANHNAEAETIKVALKPKPRLKKLVLEKDFSEIAIRGRQTRGNILTRHDVHRITLDEKGASTLGDRKVWFDPDVLRLNYEERGKFLGEFHTDDEILVMSKNGEYYMSSFELTNHYEQDILLIEKFDSEKIWTCALYDANQKYYYLKRFQLESTESPLSILGDNPDSRMIVLTDKDYPRLEVVFGGKDAHRQALEIDAEEFISVKTIRARGKRLSTYEVKSIKELEPLRFKEVDETDGIDETDEGVASRLHSTAEVDKNSASDTNIATKVKEDLTPDAKEGSKIEDSTLGENQKPVFYTDARLKIDIDEQTDSKLSTSDSVKESETKSAKETTSIPKESSPKKSAKKKPNKGDEDTDQMKLF